MFWIGNESFKRKQSFCCIFSSKQAETHFFNLEWNCNVAKSAFSFQMSRMYFYKKYKLNFYNVEKEQSYLSRSISRPQSSQSTHYSHPRKAFSSLQSLPASSAWHRSFWHWLLLFSPLRLWKVFIFLARFSSLWFCASTAGYLLIAKCFLWQS